MPPPPQPTKYFLYARKSSETEDRQVASIDSQIQELRAIAERDHLAIVDVLAEAQSAKAPGRPVFGSLLNRIQAGDAHGILCWKLDRLARNPVDGGNVSWMLQQGIIRHIQTHERSYYPTDNVLLMAVELGMANQFIRDLSQNTKRGLRAKVEQGWYPGVAKPGYLNQPDRNKGERTTIKDPHRFPLLKRAFKLLLTGAYSPRQVLNKLNRDWGYRSPQRRKLGGIPLSRATLYRILNDPFYYGRFEYPLGSGNWYQGKHEPMITEEEFWRIQKILGKEGRPRPQRHDFAFAGLMQCGECQAAITAEAKTQIICGRCKRKFAASNRSHCPACETAIAKMRQAKCLYYEYYHCTKRKKPDCSQGSIETRQLETQILQLLDTLTISEKLRDWFLANLETQAERDRGDRTPVLNSLEESLANCQQRLNNLLKLKISPQNSSGDLLSDEEFANQKSVLTLEMHRLKQKMASVDNHADHWLETAAKTFNFACYAKNHFQTGSPQVKRTILSALGSNLTLFDKNLNVSLHKHFQLMQKVRSGFQTENGRFEPKNFGYKCTQSAPFEDGLCAKLPNWDAVRTYFLHEFQESIYIPELKPSL
jgi:DNA invertase Pin-like site-specific DNA recombinase